MFQRVAIEIVICLLVFLVLEFVVRVSVETAHIKVTDVQCLEFGVFQIAAVKIVGFFIYIFQGFLNVRLLAALHLRGCIQ